MEKSSKRGGYRPGAGRPKGSGRYKEASVPMRIPQSLLGEIQSRLERYKDALERPAIPLYSYKVAAGMPSPADDHIEATLDLNDYCIKNPNTTFFVRAEGESMLGAGIRPNDLLVVDRSLLPTHGKIVIAAVNGELTVKRLHCHDKGITLLPENPNYPPIPITEETQFNIWGVVTNIIHEL